MWSVLDPLLMSLIYWFVFTQVFDKGVGEQPYIVFLLTALLPWVWLVMRSFMAITDTSVRLDRK